MHVYILQTNNSAVFKINVDLGKYFLILPIMIQRSHLQKYKLVTIVFYKKQVDVDKLFVYKKKIGDGLHCLKDSNL